MENRRYNNIFKAIDEGDMKALKTLLPKHISDRDVDYHDPLYHAIDQYKTRPEILELLLSYNNDEKPIVSMAHLLQIFYRDMPELIQTLTNQKLNLDTLLYGGTISGPHTALHKFCNLYFTNKKTKTKSVKKEFIKEMIRCGASTDIKDQYGKYAFDYLSANDRSDIASYQASLEAASKSEDKLYNTYFDYEV